ncbi:FAD-binding oxidoreductase [Halobacillus fulvus]|nr:FAD-binding oxidoreductase [Halobacillus fulvus]
MKHIIIGSGILGSSIAYHLVKKGERVVLVDRKEPGQATQAGAGIICPWLTNRSNQSWYQLVLGGARYYPQLIEELESMGEKNTGYSQVGAINIFDTEEKLDKKMNVAQKRKLEAPEMGEISRLSPKDTKELFPILAEQYRAVHISGGARVNGAALNQALLNASVKMGAEYVEGDASLCMEGDRVVGIKLEQQTLYSDTVIAANGAWGNGLFSPIGLSPVISFEKAQIVHLELPHSKPEEWPVLLPPYSHYQLGFETGRFVIGATKEKTETFDSRVTIGGVHELIDKALKVSPGLSEATYLGTKVGFRPFTPGSIPTLGKLPVRGELWIANGLGASGLTSGPYVGKELARVILGESSEINMKDYDPRRSFN